MNSSQSETSLLADGSDEVRPKRWIAPARAAHTQPCGGIVAVGATNGARPLLDVLGIPPEEQPKYYALKRPRDACSYCEYRPICGVA